MEFNSSYSASYFGLKFINSLPESSILTENVAFSPWALVNLVGMLLLGTVHFSDSQTEVSRTLGIDLDSPRYVSEVPHKVFQRSRERIVAQLERATAKGDKSIEFRQANLLLYNKNAVNLSANYVGALQSHYSAGVEEFRIPELSGRAPLHERVNSWVSKHTNGLITRLADESLSGDASLLLALINSAYFKGDWLKQFKSTKRRSFFNGGSLDQATEAEFLEQTAVFRYAEFNVSRPASSASADHERGERSAPEERRMRELTEPLNCRVLSLPYALDGGQAFAMMLLLPNKLDAVGELQKKLSPSLFPVIMNSLTNKRLDVSLPKFSFEMEYDVMASLKAMGVETPFKDSVDLSNMFDEVKRVKVNRITHKTRIQVDERGSEAASASILTIVPESAMIGSRVHFDADHPFLYAIVHLPTRIPIFTGRLSKL